MVWSTLQSLERLEAVEAHTVQAGEARHEAQRPGVQTENVSPEAEAEPGPEHVRSSVTSLCLHHGNRPEHPLVDRLGVQHGPVGRVEVAAVPEHGRHVAGGAAQMRVSQV